MCAQHKRPPFKSSQPRRSSLPWIGAGAGALLLAGGAFWWGLGRPQRTAERADPNDPAMVHLQEESRGLEREFARIQSNRAPNDADLAQLQRAIDFQQEWMTATGDESAEQQQRRQDLQAMYDTAWLRNAIGRTQADETAGRALLAAGKRDEGLARLRAALDLQRQLNQRHGGAGTGRDLGRETTLAQEIDRLDAEPISAEMTVAATEAAKRRDRKENAAALAGYHRAHELQLQLNREFGRTQYASLNNLEKLEVEIATLESAGLQAEAMALAGQAAEAQGQGQSQEAAALFERAAAAQQKLNTEFPRSRHASPERAETLETARQTELSTEAARRVAQLDREVAGRLRTRNLADLPEMIRTAGELQDAMFARLPRSRRLDPELRAKFNYLWLQRDAIDPILAALADKFRPIPGRGARMLCSEVPQRLFQLVMRGNPSRQSGPDLPVESVSAHDAAEFCRRLSWLLGRPVRLPTEVEYRAALAEVPTAAALSTQVWSQERSDQRPHAVGSSMASAAGYYDLLGNVAEWLAPDRSDAETTLVVGGSYADPEVALAKVPTEKRSRLERARTIGFRVVAE